MRIICFIAVIAALLSCKKDHAGSNSLVGNWMWTHSYSGWGGNQESTPEHYQELRLTEDHSYTWLINGSVHEKGHFSITKEPSIFSGEDEWMLNLNGMLESPFLFEQSSNELVLTQNAYDGTTFYFTK